MPTYAASYEDAIVTFRGLCEDLVFEGTTNEYVRGGVNLIADLFGVDFAPTDERMAEVLVDLCKVDEFALPGQTGIRPYRPNPDYDVYTYNKSGSVYDAPCPVCLRGPLDLKGHGAVCPNGHVLEGE